MRAGGSYGCLARARDEGRRMWMHSRGALVRFRLTVTRGRVVVNNACKV